MSTLVMNNNAGGLDMPSRVDLINPSPESTITQQPTAEFTRNQENFNVGMEDTLSQTGTLSSNEMDELEEGMELEDEETVKIFDDEELNQRNEIIYITNEQLDDPNGEWKRLIKYYVCEVSKKDLNTKDQLRFWIANNRDLRLKQGSKIIEWYGGKKMKNMVFLLLRRPDASQKYRIQLIMSVKSWGYNIYVKIFIHDKYLKRLCRNYSLAPDILETLIRDKGDRYETFNVTTSDIAVAKNLEIDDGSLGYLDKLDITPYMYQKNNIEWMYGIEKNVDLGLNKFNYLLTKNLISYKFGDLCLYMEPESGILYDEESLWNYDSGFQTVNFKGGVICDQVGLGKTLSMVSLVLKNGKPKPKVQITKKKIVAIKKKPVIQKKVNTDDTGSGDGDSGVKILTKEEKEKAEKEKKEKEAKEKAEKEKAEKEKKEKAKKEIPKSRATIILCPSRLCQQWEDEIDKYLKPDVRKDFTVLKITTKPQLEKYNYDDLCKADVVIVSYPFLCNKNYYIHQDRVKFDRVHWHRVIIDEGHEVLLPQARRKAEVQTCQTILSLPATYRWCCTGDPLARTRESFEGIATFLIGFAEFQYGRKSLVQNLSKSVAKELINEYFRRNTKQSTKDQVFIPQIKENIVALEFSPTERAVYDNAKGDTKRMMQLCTNILISDYDSNIIGNRVVGMNEINDAMSEHFKEQAIEIKNKIQASIDAEANMDATFPVELAALEARIKPYNDMKKKKIPLNPYEEEDFKTLKENRTKLKTSYNYRKKAFAERKKALEKELNYTYDQIKLFTGLNIDQITKEPCPICQDNFKEVIITKCGHIFCHECCSILFDNSRKYANCPFCRESMLISEMKKAVPNDQKDSGSDTDSKDGSGDDVVENRDLTEAEEKEKVYKDTLDRWGTKMSHLVKYLHQVFEDPTNRVIIFSQWNRMLYMVGNVLDEVGIQHVYCRGNVWTITKSITKFKRDPNIRVIMLSSETCSSGNNLTEASHVILLDTVNTSKENALAIENQAVGRAVRLGQKKSVQVLRMIIKDTVEEEYFSRNYADKVKDIKSADAILSIQKAAEIKKNPGPKVKEI